MAQARQGDYRDDITATVRPTRMPDRRSYTLRPECRALTLCALVTGARLPDIARELCARSLLTRSYPRLAGPTPSVRNARE